MSDDDEAGCDSSDDEIADPQETNEAPEPWVFSLPDCPVCGEPVTNVTVTGPHSGTAEPCGCSVLPGTLDRSPRT
ncbi:hypothetical protein [Natrinema salsiterrestre]|uniref:Small CPxCG-related zinc finger protein n=1 Tax=Natrinema salsiterrestre TaxID=2950540 RepID=A0A9Q4L0T2_9EURY|nr:hypothetical protein [Natrinema salsiterrestre]MDF9745492.1 hypothetical protein [Natrinema salsiterrestre]